MRTRRLIYALLFLALPSLQRGEAQQANVTLFPADRAVGVNPDTHLVLTFSSQPTLGKSGQVRVYDAADHTLVDTLDLSIPAGPDATWRGQVTCCTKREEIAARQSRNEIQSDAPGTPQPQYQVTRIGGMDGFHFHPVIIHGNVVTIYLHNSHLVYGRRYIVQIDPGVLTTTDGGFAGITDDRGWTFTTKNGGPVNVSRVVVAADGTGDFNTIQGAVDFVPNDPTHRVTIFIKNGHYEEIVFFRHKANLTFRGEDREKVQVGYGNSSLFNPPSNAPVARDAFTVSDSTGIQLINFSVNNYVLGQAGALSITGDKNILSHMNIIGSGDALRTGGPLYVTDSKIVGHGDTILSEGPAFFNHSEIQSWGSYVWMRNTKGNHGDIFVDCIFNTPESRAPLAEAGPVFLGRSPYNENRNSPQGRNWPYAEMVLINCRLKGIPPVGWGTVDEDTSNVHLLEYNSTNLVDGKRVDVSQRHSASRQLTMEHDAQVIANYSNPAYVLGGWTPVVEHP